ncbi:MAG: hypothetical protein ABR969_11000 [Sedimentisphaerales bacterium]
MSMTKKTILLVVSGVMIASVPCFADGVAFAGKDYYSLYPISQDTQQALISHNNGIEKMLITVALPLKLQDSAVWIFPVPGNLENVKIDLVDTFPRFRGRNPLKTVTTQIEGLVVMQFFAPLFPLNSCCLMPSLGKGRGGVYVYGEVDKWGIHTEILKSDSLSALSQYLNEKKTDIDPEYLRPFESYLSDKYVLVVSWIASTNELLKQFPEYEVRQRNTRWPCLYVEFPSEKAFYPMRPTTASGNSSFFLRLLVLDYVNLAGAADVNRLHSYFYRQKSMPKELMEAFVSDFESQKGRYTFFRFNGNVKAFSDDLWFEKTIPRGMLFAEKIEPIFQSPFFIIPATIGAILIMSYVSAGLSGLWLFRIWRGFAFLGLANLFGIIGLYIESHFIKGKVVEKFKDVNRPHARTLFLVVFSIIYLLLSLGIVGMLILAEKILSVY